MTDLDDAPLDRTGAAVTQADLFDTAQWLDRRVGAVRDDVSQMAAGSGDITERIMGDLAGIRSEQIHLARRLDMLGAELRLDIRKELRRSDAAEASPVAPTRSGHRAGAWFGFFAGMILVAMLALLALVLLPVFGLVDWLPEAVRDRLPGQVPWRGEE